MRITLDPGGGFSGRIDIGASLYGSGHFHGTRNGNDCQAVSDDGHLRFQGACTDTSFTGRYTIDGQQGTLSVGVCPDWTPPPPPGPVPDPFVPPKPIPPEPVIAPKLCGRVHNETKHFEDSIMFKLTPGGGFSGRVDIGAGLYGSGDFHGTRNGDHCEGATNDGHLRFQGTCTADSFTGTYTVDGLYGAPPQSGTMQLDADSCVK